MILQMKKCDRKRHKKNDDFLSKQEQQQDVTYTENIIIPNYVSHYIMNLPDSAIDFLSNFIGLYNSETNNISNSGCYVMPWIHVHCFEKHNNDEEPTLEQLHKRIYKRILFSMNTNEKILPIERLSFHLVRKVSPTKPMFCVSFKLSLELTFANGR